MQHHQIATRRHVDEEQELTRLRRAIAAAGDLVYEWDLATDRLTWSGRTADMFGAAGAGAAGSGAEFELLIHPDDRLKRREARDRHVGEGTSYDCDYRVRSDSGEYCWVHDRGCAELSSRGRPLRFTGILRVVTVRKQVEARLEECISYDGLTGHYSRVRLRDALDHALAYCVRYRTTGAYLTVGIDNLTQVNEARGYKAADAVILGVGQILDRELRLPDVIGRMEGDRFGVVLGNCKPADVARVADRILGAVRAAVLEMPAGPVRTTVSIGGVTFPTVPGQTAHDIMRHAELALQQAKQRGRDRFAAYRFSETQRRQRKQDMALTRSVQAALQQGRIAFAYQPVVRADTQRVEYYECLLRILEEDGEVIPASRFIPVVERMGLSRSIDHRVANMAIDELIRDPGIVLAINVSGLTAGDRAWLRLLVYRVKDRPDVARRLIVEITETVALHDIEETASFVAAVRSLGCRVAIDDFGAGYTSFRHLQTLAVDMVKIDGSFIRNLGEDLDNQLFVKTLLSLAQGFGLRTVAECVETAEEAGFLTGHGVQLLQGYYFGRPSLMPMQPTPWEPVGRAPEPSPAFGVSPPLAS